MLQYNLLERNCIRIVRSGVRASLLLNCPEQDTPNNWPHSNSTDPGYSKTSGGRRERLCGCPALSLGPGFDVAGIRPVRGCVRSYINFPSNLRPAPDCLSFRLVSSLEALAPFEKETSVTALSDAVSYTFLLPMKFQVSFVPGSAGPIREGNFFPGVGQVPSTAMFVEQRPRRFDVRRILEVSDQVHFWAWEARIKR